MNQHESELSITVLRALDGNRLTGLQLIRINEPVVFRAITVKEGFICNLGSIPFGFRWLVRPFFWRSIKCYVVHDYLCERANDWDTRKLADQTLREHLKDQGIRWRAPIIYLAVRLYAWLWFVFKKN